MKGFARVTKLSNIGGRADYISNPARQEKILAASDPVDWKPYQDYERNNQRTAVKNNEGREVIIAIPNEWAQLPPAELQARAKVLAETAAGKTTDLQWAVHWNKAHSNLHIHAIFSERQREKAPGRWDRDIYLTEDGKVARRKADRAKNPDGTDRPPVHRKGEEKGGFTAKDRRYIARSWVADMKEQLARTFADRWGVLMEQPEPLHQYHEGKGREAATIREKNRAVKLNNANYPKWRKAYPQIKPSGLKSLMVKGVKQGKVLVVTEQGGRLMQTFVTPQEWEKALADAEAARKARQTPQKAPETVKPEKSPAEPFAALLAAQKAFYREAFAVADKRKPLNPAVSNAPATLLAAAQDLKAAQDALKAASLKQFDYKGIKGLFRGKEKQAAESAYYEQVRRVQSCLDRIGKMGVSLAFDGEQISPASSTLDGNRYAIETRIRGRVTELKRLAEQEVKHARPADALKGSVERLEAARAVFTAELDKIPAEQTKAARNALDGAERGLSGGYHMADYEALLTVRTETRRRLPLAQEQEQTRTKSRSRGHDR